jgi:hypothetical protein
MRQPDPLPAAAPARVEALRAQLCHGVVGIRRPRQLPELVEKVGESLVDLILPGPEDQWRSWSARC